jgi:hypothetical protein
LSYEGAYERPPDWLLDGGAVATSTYYKMIACFNDENHIHSSGFMTMFNCLLKEEMAKAPLA